MGNILLVHQSRVIRATLSRHLEEQFKVLEVLDGESAWQTLVLDHDVVAVIAGPDIPRLSGLDLLERLRRNRLQRLKHIPFYLIGSETRIEEITDEARKLGVTDFILNGMGKWEILPLLQAQKTAAAREASPSVEPVRLAATAKEGKPVVHFRDTGLLSASLFEEGVRRMFARVGDLGAVLVFGVDGYSGLVDHLGKSTASRIAEKFARLVQGKIGASDFMGHHGAGRFAIATRSSRLDQCEAFAKRVARSLANAQIVVRGKPVQLTISSGAASRPEDGMISGEALLALALGRMEAAMAAGGGRVQIHGEGLQHTPGKVRHSELA